MAANLVEGRACGECNVCCVALTITEPSLMKASGFRCRNAQADNSCAIYDARPHTCRTFHCGWRHLGWVGQALRPDISGVLVNLVNVETDKGTEAGVAFVLLRDDAADAAGLADAISVAVAADVPTYIAVPGPPGYTSAQARVNDDLRDAVRVKDERAVLAAVRQVWRDCQDVERVPVSIA